MSWFEMVGKGLPTLAAAHPCLRRFQTSGGFEVAPRYCREGRVALMSQNQNLLVSVDTGDIQPFDPDVFELTLALAPTA